MKKTKLLLATPLLITPFVATIPFASTSCHKDVTSFGDLEEYVDHDIVEDHGAAFIHLSVKSSETNRYLPNSLKSVSTGGRKLTPVFESNGRQDYYTYTTLFDNKEAMLYIYDYAGTVQIEAETATLTSISAEGYDISGRKVAEFEANEWFLPSYYNERVTVTGTLSNGDEFEIDDYELTLPGYTYGRQFLPTTEGVKKGKAKFAGKTAEFDFRVDLATTAFYTFIDPTTYKSTVTKIKTSDGWKQAITKFNGETAEGFYIISLPDGEYTLDNTTKIVETTGKYLTFRSYNDVYFEESSYQYPVTMNTTAAGNTFSITSVDDEGDSTVNVYGIKFTSGQNGTSLVTLGDYAHDIVFEGCGFYNTDSADMHTINGIDATGATTKAPTNVALSECTANRLQTLFNGNIAHSDELSYDFTIADSSVWTSKQLFNISGDGVHALIFNNYAQLMSSDNPDSAMIIGGTGEYDFIDCQFDQGKAVASGETKAFIETKHLGGETKTTRKLFFEDCSLVRLATADGIHDVYNNCSSGGTITGEDWTIEWYDYDGTRQDGTVYSNPTAASGEKNTWDHE